VVRVILLETVFRHVEGNLPWKPRRWGCHCARTSIPRQQPKIAND
jgi:hypothetical protein